MSWTIGFRLNASFAHRSSLPAVGRRVSVLSAPLSTLPLLALTREARPRRRGAAILIAAHSVLADQRDADGTATVLPSIAGRISPTYRSKFLMLLSTTRTASSGKLDSSVKV